MYNYLVAYTFQQEGYLGSCFGTIQIFNKKKLKTFEQINSLNKFIESKIEGASNVAVYNFILLGRSRCSVEIEE